MYTLNFTWFSHFLTLPLHALFYITLAYITGIWLCAGNVLIIYLGMCTLTVVCSLYYRSLWPIILLCASGVGSCLLYRQRHTQELFYQHITGKTFNICGTITNIAPLDHKQFHYCMSVSLEKMEEITTHTTDYVSGKTVQIYIKDKPSFLVGDTIEIAAVTFKKINGTSFNDYIIKEGISATLFLPILNACLLERPNYSYDRWLFYLREKIVTAIKKKMSPASFNLFTVLFLGKHTAKTERKEVMKDTFAAWGLTHYLARSGLHMVIFVVIWHMLLNALPLPFIIKQIVLLTLGLWYYALSWASISFNRAFVTFLLQKWCALFFVRADLLHLLTLVCLGTLLVNPSQTFFLDFQLSFGLTFALALMNKISQYQRVNG